MGKLMREKAEATRKTEVNKLTQRTRAVLSADIFRRSYYQANNYLTEYGGVEKIEDVAVSDEEISRLEEELRRAECDNTGALKWKSFGRSAVDMFVGPEPQVKAEVRKGTYEYAASEKMKKRHFIFVAAAELDRLNSEGKSHNAGDYGLSQTVAAINRVAQEHLGERTATNLSIYRYGGNEYCVQLDDTEEREAAAIRAQLQTMKISMGKYADVEGPPLVVSGFSFAGALDIMNVAEIEENEAYAPIDPFEAAHLTLGIIKRNADYNLEAEKFSNRLYRAMEKLQEAKDGKISRSDAESFFNSFLKKGLHGSGFASLETVDDLWRGGRDENDLRHTVEILSAAHAASRFENDRKFSHYADYIINGYHRELIAHLRPPIKAEKRENMPAAGEDLPVAKIPSLTEGQKILASRHYDWVRSEERGYSSARANELKFLIEAAKRDAVTGLPDRGEYYENLQQALEKDEEKSVIFLDLGFLKYFNDAGGRTVGDAALIKLTEIIEEAIAENGVEATPYHYGGDELTIVVSGDREEAERLALFIKENAASSGAIPDKKGLRRQGFLADNEGESRPDYRPTPLVVNYGVSSFNDCRRVLDDLREKTDLDGYLETRGLNSAEYGSELTTHLADVGIGFEKAVSRFHYLLHLMDDERYKDENSAYHRQVESIIDASKKAILDSLGGDAALRFWYQERKYVSEEEVRTQVERFVAERLERADILKQNKTELADKIIGLHAVRDRLDREVRRLDELLINERGELDDAKRERNELFSRLKEVEEHLSAAAEGRQEIKNAIDKNVRAA
jgi:diguanylate cyclase (GGDEF)-like protein